MSQFVHDPGDISAIQSSFGSGASDPVRFLETLLQRAEVVEPHIHAWLSLDADAARRQARTCRDEMQQGINRGPLHGIPVAIKDVVDIEGQQTRAGSTSREESTPAALDANIVANLRAAGAIIMGKVHTTEYAYFEGPPPTRNPWHASHTPGGSSAGSAAAVASGTAVCSIGTQTAGSVVRPAAYCGIAAFKPTTQDLSTAGLTQLAPSFDTVGWFGYRMSDVATISAALQPQRYKHARSTHPLRIAMLEDPLFADADTTVRDSLGKTGTQLRDAGHQVTSLKSAVDLATLLSLHQTVLEYELSHIYGELETTHPDKVSEAWLAAIIRGKKIKDSTYADALHRILWMQLTFWDVCGDIDVVIAPAAPDIAPEGMKTGDPRYIIPFTALGGPIATVPVGLAPSGLPLGVMLCSRPATDAILLGQALSIADVIEMPRS
ncbi:Glutamyl-tRNA(Gln) amidotransferase subunit A OS=Afipia felis OX=1035 GN=gatA_2 PE=4 SV=1 [Afipia felis]